MDRGILGAPFRALTRERLTPGNTATGVSDSVRVIGKELIIPNGSDLLAGVGIMEAVADPPTGWTDAADTTGERDATTYHGGASSLKVTAGAAGAHDYIDVTTVAGALYRIRFWYKNTAGDFAGIGVVDDPGGTPADVKVGLGKDYWQATAGTITLTSTTDFAMEEVYFYAVTTSTRIKLVAVNNTDIVWFDDVDVRRLKSDSFMAYPRYQGAHARQMNVYVESQSARICIDGSYPSNSTASDPYKGVLVTAGSGIQIMGEENIADFMIVDAVSGSACSAEIVCLF